MSVVVPAPDEDARSAPLVSFAAAVAMVDALAAACGVRTSSKWPNDVLAGERKIAGILAEARAQAGEVGRVIVGTGVNVLQSEEDLPPGARMEATSVAIEGGRPDMEGLLGAYLRGLRSLVEPPPGAGGVRSFAERVLEPYRRSCSTIGRVVRVRTAGGEDLEGTAVGVGPTGELLLRTGDEPVTVGFGEVAHLRVPGG